MYIHTTLCAFLFFFFSLFKRADGQGIRKWRSWAFCRVHERFRINQKSSLFTYRFRTYYNTTMLRVFCGAFFVHLSNRKHSAVHSLSEGHFQRVSLWCPDAASSRCLEHVRTCTDAVNVTKLPRRPVAALAEAGTSQQQRASTRGKGATGNGPRFCQSPCRSATVRALSGIRPSGNLAS